MNDRDARPRVMRVVTRLNIGGPARQVLLLTRSLAQLGYRTELVAGSEGPREGRLEASGVPVSVLPGLQQRVAPAADLRVARALVRRLRAGSPDIVHTHMAKAGALGRAAARWTGGSIVVHTFHGHVLDGYFSKPLTRTFVAFERRLAGWTDALVAVSSHVRDELLDLGIGRPSQWRVIRVGLELDHLLSEERSRGEARRILGLPAEGPLVGSVGRLVPIKDLGTFLQAAARVARERPDATFVVAGDGELRGHLETRARTMLGDRVRFLGWVSDLPALYTALDVVTVTSRNEGTPTALIEASATGRPVVATRVGGVPEVVRDGLTGLLVPPGDPASIASGILALIEDQGRAQALGAAGRSWVRDRFSADRLTREVADLYRELLDRRHHRPRRAGSARSR